MPFEKGEKWKGNAKGRPKGSGLSLTTIIKEKLEEIPEGKKKTYAELLIESMLFKAVVDGDTTMQKAIWNYIDGMPTQRLEHTTPLDEMRREFFDKLDELNEEDKCKKPSPNLIQDRREADNSNSKSD